MAEDEDLNEYASLFKDESIETNSNIQDLTNIDQIAQSISNTNKYMMDISIYSTQTPEITDSKWNKYNLDENEYLQKSTSSTADITIPKEVLNSYSKNQIVYSPLFYTNPNKAYPSRNCRINIYSYNTHDKEDITIEDDQYTLNKFMFTPFKIIDICQLHNVTQLTLIPIKSYDLEYAKHGNLDITEEIIKKSRISFEKSFDNNITPNMTAEKNTLPIGTYTCNDEYHFYNKTGMCSLLAVFIRLNDFYKEEYLKTLQNTSTINKIYAECLNFENRELTEDEINARIANEESGQELDNENLFIYADALLYSLQSKINNEPSSIENFIVNEFDYNNVSEEWLHNTIASYSKFFLEDSYEFVKSIYSYLDLSPKKLIKYEKSLMKLYKKNYHTYVYESDLSPDTIKLYKKGQILNELSIVNAQTKDHKPTKTCVFKIHSPYEWTLNETSESNQEEESYHSFLSQKYKVIDIYEKNGVTLITLMTFLPQEERLYKQKKVSLEKQFNKKSREEFEKSFNLNSTYETFKNTPIGIYQDGDKYEFYQSSDICNLLNIKSLLFYNMPIPDAIKYNEKIDPTKLLLEYNNYQTSTRISFKNQIDEYLYSKGIDSEKCIEFSKKVPSIINKLIMEDD